MSKVIYVCRECGWQSDSEQLHKNCFGELRGVFPASTRGDGKTTIYISPEQKAQLLEIAKEVGAFSVNGRYTGQASISKLAQDIASGRVRCSVVGQE